MEEFIMPIKSTEELSVGTNQTSLLLNMKGLEKHQKEFINSDRFKALTNEGESRIVMKFDNGLYPVMVHKFNVSEDGVIEISDDIDDKTNYLHIYDSSDLKWLGLAENLDCYCEYLRKKVDELNHDIVELRNESKVLTEDNDRLSNRVKELVIEKQALEKEKYSANPIKFGEYDAPEPDIPEPDMEKAKKGMEVLGISVEEKKSDDSTTESMVDHITLSKENEDLKFRLENLQKTNIQYRDDLFHEREENEKLKAENEKLQQVANQFEYYKSLVDKQEAMKKERQNKIALLKKLTDILLEDDE